ncbi:MAG: hypothetical protein AAF559_14425 [Pseudomonadota bacterium]
MKASSVSLTAALVCWALTATLTTAACASDVQDTAAVTSEDTNENYLDAPQTPGDWLYVDEPAESLGLFGIGNPVHPFVIRCDKRTRRIGLARRTEQSGPLAMVITTETTKRQMVAQSVKGYGLAAADLDPGDSLFDAMAITKGRFVVEVEGEDALYVPAWAEVSRVIEDCR